MPGFKHNRGEVFGYVLWTGDPDDVAAHQFILNHLSSRANAAVLSAHQPLSNPIKGNLGEFIAYSLGKHYVFSHVNYVDTANAWDPLSNISRPGVDIIWLYFGDDETSDWAAVQEVKTTGTSSLQIADALISDYEKLFGDDVRLTLQTRLGALKNKMDQQGQCHLAPRATALIGPNPQRSNRIQIIPTLVYDADYDASSKMTSVRQALMGRGWSPDSVECWSVAIGNLDDRLSRLTRGEV